MAESDPQVQRAIEQEVLSGDTPDAGRLTGGAALGTSAAHAGEARGGGSPDQLTADEIEARSLLATSIERDVFPADREALLESARRLGAPDIVKDQIASLPEGTFDHVEAVWEALGGRVEYRE